MKDVMFDYAVNHDPDAIAMHQWNHPYTKHFTENIMKIKLGKYLKWGQRVSFMWASPDCTSHSNAKGDKPIERGLRILPMGVWRACNPKGFYHSRVKGLGKLPATQIYFHVCKTIS